MTADQPKRRLQSCVERWPECETGEYNPSCCRFPKSCSATVYDPETIPDDALEPASGPAALAAAGAGAEVDRARLIRLIEDVTERAQRDGLHVASEVADSLAVLAARGDAATPTVTTEQVERARLSEPMTYLPGQQVSRAAAHHLLAALGIEVTP